VPTNLGRTEGNVELTLDDPISCVIQPAAPPATRTVIPRFKTGAVILEIEQAVCEGGVSSASVDFARPRSTCRQEGHESHHEDD
jgi:hypothetical protein